MGIVYVVALLVYVAIVSIIYRLVKKLKNKWISRVVLTVLILLPTYDIIITKVLLFYYCNFTETEKVYRTVENPESVYFEDKISKYGSKYKSIVNMEAKMYLQEYHSLASVEFYNAKNSILHYELDKEGKIVKSEISTPLAKYHVYRKVKHINSFVDHFIFTRNIIIKDALKDEVIADLKTYNAKKYNFMFYGIETKTWINEGCKNNIFAKELYILNYIGMKKDKWSKDGNK